MPALLPYDVVIFTFVWFVGLLIIAIVTLVKYCARRREGKKRDAVGSAEGGGLEASLVDAFRMESDNSSSGHSAAAGHRSTDSQLLLLHHHHHSVVRDTELAPLRGGAPCAEGTTLTVSQIPTTATTTATTTTGRQQPLQPIRLVGYTVLAGIISWLVTLILFAILGSAGFLSLLLFSPQLESQCSPTCDRSVYSEECCTYLGANLGQTDVWIRYGPNLDTDVIHGWYIRNVSSTSAGGVAKLSVLYNHGSGGNVASAYRFERYQYLLEQGNTEVFVYDYPGYGKSRGTATADRVSTAAAAALRWFANFSRVASNPFPPPVPASSLAAPLDFSGTTAAGSQSLNISHVTLLGRSMGGAMATYLGKLANGTSPSMILQSVFSSVGELAEAYFPMFGWLWAGFAASQFPQFSNLVNIAGFKSCLYQTHSLSDEWIPYAEAISVQAVAMRQGNPTCSEFLPLSGVKHTQALTPQERTSLSQWLTDRRRILLLA